MLKKCFVFTLFTFSGISKFSPVPTAHGIQLRLSRPGLQACLLLPKPPPPTRLLSEDLALHSFGPAVPTPGMPSASFLSSHPHPATSNPRGPVKPSSWYDPRCSPCPDSSAHNTLLSRNTAQAPAGSLSCLFIHACQIAPRSLKAPRSQGPLF